MHVFLIGMCQNSVADGQIHNIGDQKSLTLHAALIKLQEVSPIVGLC